MKPLPNQYIGWNDNNPIWITRVKGGEDLIGNREVITILRDRVVVITVVNREGMTTLWDRLGVDGEHITK